MMTKKKIGQDGRNNAKMATTPLNTPRYTAYNANPRHKTTKAAIGYLGHFFGSLGPCAGGPVSHRAMQSR
jgi:hypothetical protein